MQASEPDHALVRLIVSGDAQARRRALGLLFDRYAEPMLNVAWRVTGDHATAQDVVQDVFVTLPARISSFRGESSLSAWLYRIAINRAIDLQRHDVRRPAARLSALPDEQLLGAHSPGSAAHEPAEPAEPDDPGTLRVQAALAALSPKLRAIAVLRYVEGLSYEQLAEVLGVRIGTVKSRLNRAHAALAKRLGLPGP